MVERDTLGLYEFFAVFKNCSTIVSGEWGRKGVALPSPVEAIPPRDTSHYPFYKKNWRILLSESKILTGNSGSD
jgi:hypothetical protein